MPSPQCYGHFDGNFHISLAQEHSFTVSFQTGCRPAAEPDETRACDIFIQFPPLLPRARQVKMALLTVHFVSRLPTTLASIRRAHLPHGNRAYPLWLLCIMREILSPFTKEFRAEEQFMSDHSLFSGSTSVGLKTFKFGSTSHQQANTQSIYGLKKFPVHLFQLAVY